MQKCKCQRDCSTTKYSYSVYTTKIDADLICSDRRNRRFLIYGDTKSYYQMPPKFIFRYEQIMFGKKNSEAEMKWCIERVKNMAIVNFQISNQIMTRIMRSRRVTFADQLSNIGE